MQDIYRKIQQEYENNRNSALAEVERKKKEIYEKEPKILDIDDKIKKIGMEVTKSIIFIDDDCRNINSAKKIGIKTFEYKSINDSFDEIIKEINKL